MLLINIIAHIIFVGPPAVILCLCSLLGMWLVFARTHLVIRMPAFLLGTLPIGLGLCIAAATPGAVGPISSPPWDGWLLLCISETTSDFLFVYFFAAALIAVSFIRTNLLVRLLTFALGTLILLSVFRRIGFNSLDSEWIVRITLATSLVAGMIGTIRWFGCQVVNLTEGVLNDEIEKGTGRDLDEWIATLNAARGQSLNRAEIMACLRQYGFSFEWQRTIAIAYEKAVGRRAVGQSAIGKSQIVVPAAKSNLTDLLNRPTQQQFSIWQLMLLTFAVASLLGFVRGFTLYRPTAEDFKLGVPLAVGVAAISVSTILGCLAIRSRILIASLVAFAIASGVSIAMGTLAVNPVLQYLLFWILLAYAGLLMASLILIRHRGYRLVHVQLR